MLDFETMHWERSSDVVLESDRTPASWPPGQRMTWHATAALVLRTANGKARVGMAEASVPEAHPGDVVTLLDSGRFDLDVVCGGLAGHTVRLGMSVSVGNPATCADQFPALGAITAEDFAVRLGAHPSLGSLLRHAGLPAQSDPSALRAALERWLFEDFGLVLHQLEEPEVGADSTSFRPRAGNELHGHWRLEHPLGSGAFGDVWLAVHTDNAESRRAVKFPALNNPGSRKMLAREAQAAVTLSENADHTHLAVLYDYLPDPLALFYEFIDGTDLRTYVGQRGGILPAEEATRLARELLLGLEQLHQIRPHRDLRPENLMVEARTGRLKVIDYGFMLPAGAANAYASYVTHPVHPFAEPPARRGPLGPDARTDLYSVGLLLWWMVTGREHLPVGRTFADAAPSVGPQLLAIIEQSCAADRSVSVVAAQEMLALLEPTRPGPSLRMTGAGAPVEPGLVEQIQALVDDAVAFSQAPGHNSEQVLARYDEVLRRTEAAPGPAVVPEVARALGGKVSYLVESGAFQQAFAACEELMQLAGKSHDESVRKWFTWARACGPLIQSWAEQEANRVFGNVQMQSRLRRLISRSGALTDGIDRTTDGRIRVLEFLWELEDPIDFDTFTRALGEGASVTRARNVVLSTLPVDLASHPPDPVSLTHHIALSNHGNWAWCGAVIREGEDSFRYRLYKCNVIAGNQELLFDSDPMPLDGFNKPPRPELLLNEQETGTPVAIIWLRDSGKYTTEYQPCWQEVSGEVRRVLDSLQDGAPLQRQVGKVVIRAEIREGLTLEGALAQELVVIAENRGSHRNASRSR